MYVLVSRGASLVIKTARAPKTNVSSLIALSGADLASDGNLEI